MRNGARRLAVSGALAILLAVTLSSLASAAGGGDAVGGTSRYIVVLKDSVERPSRLARTQVGNLDGKLGFVYNAVLNGYSAQLSPQAVESLRRNPKIEYVAVDGEVAPVEVLTETISGEEVELSSQTVPSGVSRVFAATNKALDIDGADDLRADVDVAVIDSGASHTHPDLNVVARTDCSIGTEEEAECLDESGFDFHGHGTHVAGTIGAIDNSIGVVGVAPGARIWAVKALGSGPNYISEIVAGLNWVTGKQSDEDPENDIEVVNMSFTCEASSSECPPKPLNEAITESAETGVVPVVAAGNQAKNAQNYAPANSPDAVTVSALTDYDGKAGGKASVGCANFGPDDELANFSNFGTTIELVAPGVCILSTVPGGYSLNNGTSMSSPHVAGAAALLASEDPPQSKAEVGSLVEALEGEGNFNWTDTSGDGVKEPLLDVSDEAVFSILEPPAVSTQSASGVTGTEATVNGTVNPHGVTSSYRFEYGKTTSYGTKIPVPDESVGAGAEAVAVGKSVSGLTPHTTYHYRVVASNSAGISFGEDRTFTTKDTMPIKALSFGSTGTGDGQFALSRGIAVEPDGELWVADGGNDRIQKFNESGEYLGKFGSSGTGNGQFDTPVDIAITAGGDLWVTDAFNCRVQKFDSTGKYLDQFGTCGLGEGEFVEPSGIAIAPDGHIWVTDHLYDRVAEFDASGEFLQFHYSEGGGGFFAPQGIAIGSDGHIWVADGRNNRVQELSPEGDYLSEFGTYGTGDGQFAEAVEIDITPSGRIWVADRETGRVQAFNTSGHHLGTFGSFFEPAGIAAGPEGSVYVSDSRNDRVQKWRLAAAPSATTLSAQEVTPTQAKLRGTVNAQGFATTYRFEYGKTTSYGTKVPVPDKSAGAGIGATEVSQAISSLTPGTTYHYRLVAQSDGGGPVYGEDQSFETPPTPTQLAAMATTKAFDGSGASLADFAANWSTLGWASGANPKGSDTSTGWRVVDVNPTVNGTFFNSAIADTGSGIAAVATMAANPFYAGRYFSLWLDMANPSAATRSGYELRLTYVGANTFDVALSKWQSGTQTVLASKTGVSFADGNSLALVDKGGTVSAWTKAGSEFTQLLTAEDTAFASGNAGLEGAGNLTRLTNFKTGPLMNPVANMDAALKGLAVTDAFAINETPLSGGGSWAALAWANGGSGKNTGRVSLGWGPYDLYPTINGAYWTKALYSDTGAGLGVAATLSTNPGSTSRYFSLWLDMPSPQSARTGYELRFTETSVNTYEVVISKWQAGAKTALATKTGYSFATGSQLALVDKGATISAWTKTGSEFTQLLTAEDTAFISGYAGIEGAGNNARLKDFKSGGLAPF